MKNDGKLNNYQNGANFVDSGNFSSKDRHKNSNLGAGGSLVKINEQKKKKNDLFNDLNQENTNSTYADGTAVQEVLEIVKIC